MAGFAPTLEGGCIFQKVITIVKLVVV